jgi:nitronate monooxygenase
MPFPSQSGGRTKATYNALSRTASLRGIALKTFRELLGVELPIIQAPMAGVQGSELAIAVSNAGGLGSLPCAMLSVEQMRSEITAIKAGSDKPFNVNFFCHKNPEPDPARETAWRAALQSYYEEFGIDPAAISAGPGRAPFSAEAADVLEDFRPAVVSFHFGLPPPELMARVKSMGARVLSSATTVDEAMWLEAHGADGIIAQGAEAGGHRGMFLTDDVSTQMGTFAGASVVQLGTSYLLCPEATTSAVHREALRSEDARHTRITRLFSGRPARGIVNRLMREMERMETGVPAFPLAATALAGLRKKAESTGDRGFSPLWCGENATGCAELSAADLTRALLEGVRFS